MKELFDAYFLDDSGARAEYNNFTISVEKHFAQLKKITVGEAEKTAIHDLHASYKEFVLETSSLLEQNQGISNDATKNAIKRSLNSGLETGLFKRYEDILAHTERLLSQKQTELDKQLIGIINTLDRLERWTGALLACLLPLNPQPSNTTIKDIVEGALAPLQQKNQLNSSYQFDKKIMQFLLISIYSSK